MDFVNARNIKASQPRPFPCKRCGGVMKDGIATGQTLTGIGDFHDADSIMTLSVGGPGAVIPCLKCEDCGWSTTPIKERD